jgi:hypothetical protein
MNNQERFEDMLMKQNAVNSRVSTEWKTCVHTGQWDYLLAGIEELIELANCIEILNQTSSRIGYKWWSKPQDKNIAALNVIIELVDAWHFFMSHNLAYAELNEIALKYKIEYEGVLAENEFIEANRRVKKQSLIVLYLIKELIAKCAIGWFRPKLFFSLCLELKVDLKLLHTVYIAKATLNVFRQDNGYKEGRYIKEWVVPAKSNTEFECAEDNRWLILWLMQQEKTEITPEEISFWLNSSYREQLLRKT